MRTRPTITAASAGQPRSTINTYSGGTFAGVDQIDLAAMQRRRQHLPCQRRIAVTSEFLVAQEIQISNHGPAAGFTCMAPKKISLFRVAYQQIEMLRLTGLDFEPEHEALRIFVACCRVFVICSGGRPLPANRTCNR